MTRNKQLIAKLKKEHTVVIKTASKEWKILFLIAPDIVMESPYRYCQKKYAQDWQQWIAEALAKMVKENK